MQNTKIKKKTLKLTAEKKITAVRGIADCNRHNSRSGRLCKSIFKVLRKNNFSLRVLYPTKLFLKSGGKIYFQTKTLLMDVSYKEVAPGRKEG